MSKAIPFQKLHGTGNDFIVVDAADFIDSTAFVSAACEPHRGVGADGILVVDLSGEAPRMIIYNKDGSRPEMCGNGVRCVARWLVESHGYPEEFVLETDAGPRACRVFRDSNPWRVRVDMGAAQVDDEVTVAAAGHTWSGIPVDMGNPHFVVFAEKSAPALDVVGAAGQSLNRAHPKFPNGVNFEVVELTPSEAVVTVFERGVGFTQACGTGACAVAVAGMRSGVIEKGQVARIRLPGGVLEVEEEANTVWMTGDAELVFAGQFSRDWLEARGL